ncbi:MAG: hypothetical protein COA57_08605 [Flavobacteriales bacterium]|nr:MAG: hypothetical protein COA57_08605 [Flavobacteriales bacterium]
MKKIISLLIAFTIASPAIFAQKNYTWAQKRKLNEANYLFDLTDYHSALGIYNELYQIDSLWPELNHRIGVCIFESSREKLQALNYFEKASAGDFTEAHYYLARCYHLQSKFNNAISLYLKYKNDNDVLKVSLEELDRLIKISERAKQMTANPISVKIENLSKKINTQYAEYVPVISADESMLIFTSRREGSTGGLLDPYGQFFEDIYISMMENDEWTAAKNIGTTINDETHNACAGLSSDGNILITYKTNKELTGGDLYWSELNEGQWSTPVKYPNKINSQFQEPSASLTADGNILYFSSNRPSGYGGKDIYRVVKFANGEWSFPVNLGPPVNSSFDDDAPFIHPDGKTLYFSSRGHQTMGGYDIFKSTLVEENKWSGPENLGFPINTVDDDIYFVISANGKRGYYSSNKEDGFGSQDIYVINLEEEHKPVVRGVILSADSAQKPLKAKITLIDTQKNQIIGIYRSNTLTGKYILVLSLGINYQMFVEAAGYNSQTEYIKFNIEDTPKEAYMEIKLGPIKK